jgi:uncharacterized protein (TIRG00374 family)
VITAPRVARALQLGLVVAGVALFAWLVHRIGPARLVADLRDFGAAFVVVLALELLIDAFNAVAWRRILPPGVPVGFWRLYFVRQAGVAINQLTPTATVGGEVAKTVLLRRYLPASTSAASLVAARMSYALGQAIIVVLGLSTILGRIRETPDLATAVVVGFVFTLAGVLSFIWLQRRGIFATTVASVRRLGIGGALVERIAAGGAAVDTQLARFYRERPLVFAESVLWHVGGQLVGLVQLYFILHTLGVPASLVTCLAIEAFALVLDSAAFLVPARIGVQEAGRVLVFTTFGLSAATGLAIAVIVRLNQLVNAAIGLVAFAALSVRRPADR